MHAERCKRAHAILSYIKESRFRVPMRNNRASEPASNGTGSSSRTYASYPFSSMTVQLRLANLLKGVNSTMFILAVCGRRLFPESRIVGGSRSSFGKWPWQVSVKKLQLQLSQRLKIILEESLETR